MELDVLPLLLLPLVLDVRALVRRGEAGRVHDHRDRLLPLFCRTDDLGWFLALHGRQDPPAHVGVVHLLDEPDVLGERPADPLDRTIGYVKPDFHEREE